MSEQKESPNGAGHAHEQAKAVSSVAQKGSGVKLYRAHSVMKDWKRGSRRIPELPVHWFVNRDDWDNPDFVPPAPYAEAIQDYDPEAKNIYYAEHYINELFTHEEAEALKRWLQGTVDITVIVEEEELPIPQNIMPLSAIPLGGGQDCMQLWLRANGKRAEDYTLPFEVAGYYDARHCPDMPTMESSIVHIMKFALEHGAPDSEEADLIALAAQLEAQGYSAYRESNAK